MEMRKSVNGNAEALKWDQDALNGDAWKGNEEALKYLRWVLNDVGTALTLSLRMSPKGNPLADRGCQNVAF